MGRCSSNLIDFQATYNLTTVHAGNVEALRVIYSSLLLISKIFYSLNFQVKLICVLRFDGW